MFSDQICQRSCRERKQKKKELKKQQDSEKERKRIEKEQEEKALREKELKEREEKRKEKQRQKEEEKKRKEEEARRKSLELREKAKAEKDVKVVGKAASDKAKDNSKPADGGRTQLAEKEVGMRSSEKEADEKQSKSSKKKARKEKAALESGSVEPVQVDGDEGVAEGWEVAQGKHKKKAVLQEQQREISEPGAKKVADETLVSFAVGALDGCKVVVSSGGSTLS
jgi:membrane protein involved in colicin uptake